MKIDKNKLKTTALGGVLQNPTFVLVLGMCPTLGTSASMMNGLGMGLATAAVLIMTNTLISLLRKIIPDKVRIPCDILIIATVATAVDMLTKKFMPEIVGSIGQFIPLIIVNCIIFARAESFASANRVGYAALDGLSMGLGFTVSLGVLGLFRELLASGGVSTSFSAPPGGVMPIFQQAAGGFIALALLMGLFNFVYGKIKGAALDKQHALEAEFTVYRPENVKEGAGV